MVTILLKINNRESVLSLPEPISLVKLLEDLNLGRSVAVWVNERRVLQADYDELMLKDEDMVRIFKPLAGG